jgi:hypothetical protein
LELRIQKDAVVCVCVRVQKDRKHGATSLHSVPAMGAAKLLLVICMDANTHVVICDEPDERTVSPGIKQFKKENRAPICI